MRGGPKEERALGKWQPGPYIEHRGWADLSGPGRVLAVLSTPSRLSRPTSAVIAALPVFGDVAELQPRRRGPCSLCPVPDPPEVDVGRGDALNGRKSWGVVFPYYPLIPGIRGRVTARLLCEGLRMMEDVTMDLEKRAEDFFAAISRGDWEEATQRIHPTARAIQNIGGEEVNARELLKSMQSLVASLSHLSYEKQRRVIGHDAVVEQHDVCMTRKDGVEVRLDVCIILRFDSAGAITRIDEYLDSAGAARLLA